MNQSNFDNSLPEKNLQQKQIELFTKQMSSDGFNSVYGDFEAEMERVKALKGTHEKVNEDNIGFKGEKLVIDRLGKHILGDGIDVYKSAEADDILRGCDALIVSPLFHKNGEPVVVGIDVTFNQPENSEKMRHNLEKSKLEEKLSRIINGVNYLSRIDPALARDFNAWMSSDGMSKERPKDRKDPNYKFWELSDKVVQVRYFRNPPSDPINPNMPHPVIAGPRAVLSLDAVFYNKANLDNKYMRGIDINHQIDTVLKAETYIVINSLLEYMDKMISHKPQMNAIFDAYYSATKSWVNLLDQPGRKEIFEEALNEIQKGRDPLVRNQMQVYIEAIKRTFGV